MKFQRFNSRSHDLVRKHTFTPGLLACAHDRLEWNGYSPQLSSPSYSASLSSLSKCTFPFVVPTLNCSKKGLWMIFFFFFFKQISAIHPTIMQYFLLIVFEGLLLFFLYVLTVFYTTWLSSIWFNKKMAFLNTINPCGNISMAFAECFESTCAYCRFKQHLPPVPWRHTGSYSLLWSLLIAQMVKSEVLKDFFTVSKCSKTMCFPDHFVLEI